MLLCTFNVNNLFVRYRFGKTFPGDQGGKSEVATTDAGYLPLYQKGAFEIFNPTQRALAALALTRNQTVWPDVVCVQEVESLIALREFNDRFLGGRYKQALLVDSRDLRQIDVGILSQLPIDSVRSHVDDRRGSQYVFSRDCLEVRVQAAPGVPVTLFINHLKSKLVTGKTAQAVASATTRSNAKRKLQADTVAGMLKERFPGAAFDTALFAVLGDFNDMPGSATLRTLCQESGLVDAIATLPEAERWTHYWKDRNSVSQLDHLLLSPALAAKLKPQGVAIERRAVGFSKLSKKVDGGYLPKSVRFEAMDKDPSPLTLDFQFARFDTVSATNTASDHCPVFADFDL